MRHTLYLYSLIILMFGFTNKSSENKKTCNVDISNSISKEKNEKLSVNINCEVKNFHFKILNKWAETIFETSQYKKQMDIDVDGKINQNGKEIDKFQKNNIYIWYVKFEYDDKVYEKLGKLLAY